MIKISKKTLIKLSVVALMIVAVIGLARPGLVLAETKQDAESSQTTNQSGDNQDGKQAGQSKVETSDSEITLNKQIDGDVICASSSRCSIGGVVEDDVLAAALTIEIRGEVKGDVRAVANELIIASGAKIHGNVSIFAPKLTIQKGAVIGKDAMLSGGQIRIEGQIGRNAMIASEDTYIEGQIGRDANIYSSRHTRVTDTAKISGNLSNMSNTKDIAESAIAGKFTHEVAKMVDWQHRIRIPGVVLWVLTVGILLVMVTILRPKRFRDFSREQFKPINLFYIGVGYTLLFLLIMLSILAALTVIGIPFAILSLAMFMIVLILSIPLAIYYLANNTLALFGKHSEWLALVFGAFIYGLINTVPSLSISANIALVGLGAGLFIKITLGARTPHAKESIDQPMDQQVEDK